MKKNEKLVDLNELNKLGELTKLCLELTVNQGRKISELNKKFLMVIDENIKWIGEIKDDSSILKQGVNLSRLYNCLKDDTKRGYIKDCLEVGYLNPNGNLLMPILFYQELSKYEKVGSLNNVDDILSILDKCFSVLESKLKSRKAKDAATGFIAAISDVIVAKYKDNEKRSIPTDYMYNSLSNILSSIKSKNYVVINDEEKFYNYLSLYYYINAIEGDKIDISNLMKEKIDEYNSILKEEKNPVHQKAKKLNRYISRNSIDKLSYDRFPNFEDENFVGIMNETRNYIDSDAKLDPIDKASKLAIIDTYKMAYYKKNK